MPATLADIAKRTGYSTATICRVANGGQGVSAEVRNAVERAIAELGYVARRTRAEAFDADEPRERLVEVILHRSSPMEPLAPGPGGIGVGASTAVAADALLSRDWELGNDFYRGMLDGILTEISAQGGKAVVQVATALDDPRLLAGLSTEAEGVLLVGEGGPQLERFAAACPRPLVLVDMLLPFGRQEQVTTDNGVGVGQAVAHLARLGHRRIGFVSGPDGPVTRERAEAFLAHAARHGLLVPEGWAAVAYDSIAGTGERLATLLARPGRPTALVGCSDYAALAALQAAQRLGLRVPDQLSVVGFDDARIAALTTPPLTTVRVDTAALGAMGVRLLLSRGQRPPTGCTVRVPTHLVVRESTRAPAA
jgi:LacI family transcriptional regulator